MMCKHLSMWTCAHIYCWKLGPDLDLLAKVCPWLNNQTDVKSSMVSSKDTQWKIWNASNFWFCRKLVNIFSLKFVCTYFLRVGNHYLLICDVLVHDYWLLNGWKTSKFTKIRRVRVNDQSLVHMDSAHFGEFWWIRKELSCFLSI